MGPQSGWFAVIQYRISHAASIHSSFTLYDWYPNEFCDVLPFIRPTIYEQDF